MDRRRYKSMTSKPGPFGEWGYVVNEYGVRYRVPRLTADGQAMLEAWLRDYPEPLVLYAKHFGSRYRALLRLGHSQDDMHADALSGCTRAMWQWDPERTVFSTYCIHWMRQAIERSDRVWDERQKYHKGVRVVSGNQKRKGRGDDYELHDFIGQLDKNHDHSDLHDEIMRALKENVASQRYRDIFVAYYGLESGEPKTLEEVAITQGITRERVRQIVNKVRESTWHKLYKLNKQYVTNS